MSIGDRLTPTSCAFVLAISLTLVFVSHAPVLDLPFFWDEAGQFIPASLDLYRSGAFVPISVTPNAHPPGVMAYLASVWWLAGYSIVITRAAMLLLGGVCVFLVFLLGIRLGLKGVSAYLPPLALCCSPVFYAQAMLTQLDMPAALFTILAILLFLEEHIFLSAIACSALVLVKETGVVTPMLFGIWLLIEKRHRPSAYFFLPALVLGAWLLFLRRKTGFLFGSAEFTQYNLRYMMHGARVPVALAKRAYHLFVENFAWIGTAGIVFGYYRGLFADRTWRILWTLLALHIVLFSILGGAMLERYLLPVTPIVLVAMIKGWSSTRTPWRIAGPVALVAASALCNFWNPPYSFPLENNLAFVDFVRIQQIAAAYLEDRYPGSEISSAWPMSAALTHPEFGYVKAPLQVAEIANFNDSSLNILGNRTPDVFVLYSRQWNPPGNLLRNPVIVKLWRTVFPYEPPITSSEVDDRMRMKLVARWERRGQWIEVHARY